LFKSKVRAPNWENLLNALQDVVNDEVVNAIAPHSRTGKALYRT